MSELINKLRKKDFLEEKVSSMLEVRFAGTKLSLIRNEIKKLCHSKHPCYSDSVKKIAQTMYYFSPKAYKFFRQHLLLPHKHYTPMAYC